jgi:N-hydroxyarylamine O-acetyltransferase
VATVDVERYLERIGYGGWVRSDLATLAALQRAHLTTVPFENLDVYYRTGVEVGADWALDKVLERGRGGWCFELNTAFAELLRAIGFEVALRAADVLFSGQPPETPDHLVLQVSADDRPWLVDVGFGDSFCRPLALDVEAVQDGESRPYRVRRDDDFVFLETQDDGDWRRQYRFRPVDVELDVFEPASARLQSTEGLHWTETRFATRLFSGGRVTLLHDRLKFTREAGVVEELVDEARWHIELDRWFDMRGFASVDRP